MDGSTRQADNFRSSIADQSCVADTINPHTLDLNNYYHAFIDVLAHKMHMSSMYVNDDNIRNEFIMTDQKKQSKTVQIVIRTSVFLLLNALLVVSFLK